MGYGCGKFACISDKCSSSDGLEVYAKEDEETGEIFYDATCFVCGEFFNKSKVAGSYLAEIFGIEKSSQVSTKSKNGGSVSTIDKSKIQHKEKPVITDEQRQELETKAKYKSNNFRGVRDETHQFYGIRTEFQSDNLYARYYPILQDSKLVGYKSRLLPKDFSRGPVGRNSKDCELFGQFRFKSGGKYIIIVEGEEDTPAAYQMMLDYQKSKGTEGKYDPVAVVSPTCGALSAVAQIKANYEFLNKFENIIVAMDMDEAGQDQVDSICRSLPSGKVKVMSMPAKDPCECLKQNMQQRFVSAFYNAKQYVMAGVTPSTELEAKMLEQAAIERISLPPFMHRMEDMLCGGIPVGYIVNVLSASGSGKSTFIDAMILHWIMKSNKRVGIVSLEASEGEYAINLSSAFLGVKVNLFKTAAERVEYISRPENVERRKELWAREDGTPRLYVVDSDVSNIQERVDYLVKSLGCEIIVLDPLQDILDVMPEIEHPVFLKWQKDLVKREKINIININHSRKSSGGAKANSKGAELNEEDIMGTSTIFKSGGINIILMRDKEAPDELERNTTHAKITKARGVGTTGPCGEYLYVNKEHRIYDKQDYLAGNPNYDVETIKELSSGAFADPYDEELVFEELESPI